MPRLVHRDPAYRLHRATGQAVVTLSGRDVYLGAHGTPGSRREYRRVIAEWKAAGRQWVGVTATVRINDVIKAYWDHVQEYHPGLGLRTERNSIRLAMRILRRFYGDTSADDFGPLALQAVRKQMVDSEGWSRGYVNAQVGRLKRCFKWAVGQELISSAVFHGLQAVEGLRRGKTTARDTEPVKPVSEEWVQLTLPHVARPVSGLIRLQLASGMRPGEAVIMRGCDLDTSGAVWAYKPERHKTQHRGHERSIYLGPQAQAVVREFLTPDLSAYLFSPIDADRERREERRLARKTPLSCGNSAGTNVKRKKAKTPTDRYTVASYRRAIAYGCEAAFPLPDDLARHKVKSATGKIRTRWETVAEWKARLGKRWGEVKAWRDEHSWHPHQLRHTCATRLRKAYGLEAARVVLGHKSSAVAEVYAEIDHGKAEKIMGEAG